MNFKKFVIILNMVFVTGIFVFNILFLKDKIILGAIAFLGWLVASVSEFQLMDLKEQVKIMEDE